MAVLSYSLISLAELKSYLGISTSSPSVVDSIDPTVTHSVSALPINGATVDLDGYASPADVVFYFGAVSGALSGAAYYSGVLQESDDDSTWTNVSSTEISGTLPTIDGATDDEQNYTVTYLGDARYIRPRITETGSPGDIEVSAVVIRRSTDSEDSLLETLINAATIQIEKYCNNIFVQRSLTEDYNINDPFVTGFYGGYASTYNMSNDRYSTRLLQLRSYPVVSVTSITDPAGNTIASTDYHIDDERGWLRGYFPNPYDTNNRIAHWTIVYTAGRFASTAAVDATLKLAAMKIATSAYRRKDSSVASKSVGSLSISWKDGAGSTGLLAGFTQEIQSLIAPYINTTF